MLQNETSFETKGFWKISGWYQSRVISIREAARLQTFPDDFVFSNSLTDSALQIGNAVPIDLVKASGEVFREAIKCLKTSRARKQRERKRQQNRK